MSSVGIDESDGRRRFVVVFTSMKCGREAHEESVVGTGKPESFTTRLYDRDLRDLLALGAGFRFHIVPGGVWKVGGGKAGGARV